VKGDLAGQFNDRDVHSHCLRQTCDDGEWHVSLELKADRSYRLRYLAKGEERMDDE
jgi:1,4-alpha-glucan branching enzyme